MRPQSGRSIAIGFEDFQPKSEWKTEEGANILLLPLPGFKNEQIKYEKSNRIIRVFGECPIGNNIWRRFNEVLVLPDYIVTDKFSSSFENGIFKIIFPKEIVTQVDSKEAAQIASKAGQEKQEKEKSVSFPPPPKDTAEPKQGDIQKDKKEVTSEANGKPTESKMCKEGAKDTKKEVEGQLLVKTLMFVIVAVGAYISYRVGASRKAK